MLATLPLPFYFLIGGLISIFLPKGVIKSSFVCFVPVVALLALLNGAWDNGFTVQFLDLELNFMRVDKLSTVFGIIFCIAAFLGNMFATAKWYGYGKARPEGDDVSASERDRNNYIFPHSDFTLKLGVNTKLGVVGGDLKVTTPARMRIETKAQVLQSYTNETWFRWFAWEDEGPQVDGVPIKAEATATQQSTGLLNLAVQAAQFSVGGVNNDVDGIAVENPPAPGKAAAVPTQATYGAAAAATSAAASKEAQSAAGKKLGEVTQRLSDNVGRLKTGATAGTPLDEVTEKAFKSDIAIFAASSKPGAY